MAGNSRRQGAIRKTGTKKGAVVGSGGQRRKALEGKGPTPKAEDRPGHKAYRAANAATNRHDFLVSLERALKQRTAEEKRVEEERKAAEEANELPALRVARAK